MAQAGNVVLGRFDEPIRMYKAPPAHALTEHFYETDPQRGFARGFAVQTVGPLPVAFAKQMMTAKGAWGWGMRRLMMDYNHWAALGLLGEILPHAGNRVTLAGEKDQFGLPVAKVTFSLYDNDKKLIEYGKQKVMDIMWAAGAKEVVQEARYAHLVGAARMGRDPGKSVSKAIGSQAELFVDANGAYTRKQALSQGHRFAEIGVAWFEEPVSSDDLDGLRLIRDSGAPGMNIAAGRVRI